MLIEFRFKNYRSFRDEAVLSMEYFSFIKKHPRTSTEYRLMRSLLYLLLGTIINTVT